MEQRSLKLSDLATAQEAEIIKNPYQFLNLPQDSPLEQVRRSYINLAKEYYPDLVHPSFDIDKLSQLYSQKDVEAANLPYSIDEMKKVWQDPKTKPEERRKLVEGIRLMANRRMVLINRAYEEIKARYNPAEWSKLFGYDFETVFNKREGRYNKVVALEGRGEIIVYPNHFEYWVAGPYLQFDFGPDNDHPWIWDYRHVVALRHLFAHMEIADGKKVSRVLLEPMFDCFGLDDRQSNNLIDMLSEGESTESIMKGMGIPNEREVKYEDNRDGWLKSLKFRRQVNEILTLSTEPDWGYRVSWELKDNKLKLEDYTQTNFSEADYVLFLTLAYGPLLR
jgi:hypothetical protein